MADLKKIMVYRISYEIGEKSFIVYIGAISHQEAIQHVYSRIPGAKINESGKHSDLHEFTRPVIDMLTNQFMALKKDAAPVSALSKPAPVSVPEKKLVLGRPKLK